MDIRKAFVPKVAIGDVAAAMGWTDGVFELVSISPSAICTEVKKNEPALKDLGKGFDRAAAGPTHTGNTPGRSRNIA
jgi:hypothetical protein